MKQALTPQEILQSMLKGKNKLIKLIKTGCSLQETQQASLDKKRNKFHSTWDKTSCCLHESKQAAHYRNITRCSLKETKQVALQEIIGSGVYSIQEILKAALLKTKQVLTTVAWCTLQKIMQASPCKRKNKLLPTRESQAAMQSTREQGQLLTTSDNSTLTVNSSTRKNIEKHTF